VAQPLVTNLAPFPGIGRCLPIEGRCRIPGNRQLYPASLVPSQDVARTWCAFPGGVCMYVSCMQSVEFIAQLGAAFHLA
jgi:hypothetical protein